MAALQQVICVIENRSIYWKRNYVKKTLKTYLKDKCNTCRLPSKNRILLGLQRTIFQNTIKSSFFRTIQPATAFHLCCPWNKEIVSTAVGVWILLRLQHVPRSDLILIPKLPCLDYGFKCGEFVSTCNSIHRSTI